MTLEERKEAANAEFKEIGKWLNAERGRIYAELNTELGVERKFENSDEAYKKMYEELAARCVEVQRKYDLPLNTKIKFW